MKRVAGIALFGAMLLCGPGANAQNYDSLCRESGSASAKHTCYPAREGPWVYHGGSYSFQFTVEDQPSLDELKRGLQDHMNAVYGSSVCSSAVISYPGDWIASINSGIRKQDQRVTRFDIGLVSGSQCQMVGNSTDWFSMRDKIFSCDPNAQGPYVGPGDLHFCARYCNTCVSTPRPILILGGVKYFGRVYDAPVFERFFLHRSYESLPRYSGAGLLNPTKTEQNTANWRYRDDTTGWRSSFDARIVPSTNEAGTAVVYTVDIPGDVPSTFLTMPDGSFQRRQNQASSLVRLADGRFMFRRSDTTYWLFATDFKLLAVGDASGNSVTAERTVDLSALVDRFGRRVTVVTNAQHLIDHIEDPVGARYSYVFDDNARLVTATFPNGVGPTTQQSYVYENAVYPGAITGEIDETGFRISTYAYDTSGRAIGSVRHLQGGATTQVYAIDHAGVTTPKVTDPIGTVRTFSFVQSSPASVSQPAGSGSPAASSSTINDANGNPFLAYDFRNNVRCEFHDAVTSLEKVRIEAMPQGYGCGGYDAVGIALPPGARKVSTTWHPDWRLETQRAEPGRLTTSIYNGQPDPFNANAVASCAPGTAPLPDGKPIAVLCKRVEQATTDADGHLGFGAALQSGVVNRVRQWTYNQYGQVLTEKDPLNNTTTYAYYTNTAFTGVDPNAVGHTLGDLQTVTNAVGKVTTYNQYDKHGQLLQSTDPNGVVTTNTYDLRQRLVSTSVGGQATGYTYDAVGHLTRVTAPDLSWIGYEYDAAYRQTAVLDNLGNRIEYTLDNAGNRTAQNVKDPGGALKRTLARSIDALGRVQQTTGRE